MPLTAIAADTRVALTPVEAAMLVAHTVADTLVGLPVVATMAVIMVAAGAGTGVATTDIRTGALGLDSDMSLRPSAVMLTAMRFHVTHTARMLTVLTDTRA